MAGRAATGAAGEPNLRAAPGSEGRAAETGGSGAPRDETEELLRIAERCMPGGVLGRHRYPAETDHVPVEGSGARIVDSRGRSFIDYSCGGGSLILGYGHPAVVEAVRTPGGPLDAVREHPEPPRDPARGAVHRTWSGGRTGCASPSQGRRR